MADASQYPITELYGCQPGYPLNQNLCPPGQGFHNGVDYGCPYGTSVVVNGVEIGKSGATGTVTGPHLHVGRWLGGKSTPIGPGAGFSVSGGKVMEVGSDPTNGNFVRVQDADGSSWVYLHLSKQLVTVGQVLKGGNMPTIATESMVGSLAYAYFGHGFAVNPSLKTWIGHPLEEVQAAFNDAPERAAYLADQQRILNVANERGDQLNQLGEAIGTGKIQDDASFEKALGSIKQKG